MLKPQQFPLLQPQLPPVFTASDVGEACRRIGRHWSALQGVLTRLERAGYIVLTEPTWHGQRKARQWRKVDPPELGGEP